MFLLSYKHHLQYMKKKTYLKYFSLRYVLTIRNNDLLWHNIHIVLLKDLQYTVITYLQKNATNYLG